MRWLESHLARHASIRGIEVALVLITIIIFSRLQQPGNAEVFFRAAISAC